MALKMHTNALSATYVAYTNSSSAIQLQNVTFCVSDQCSENTADNVTFVTSYRTLQIMSLYVHSCHLVQ